MFSVPTSLIGSLVRDQSFVGLALLQWMTFTTVSADVKLCALSIGASASLVLVTDQLSISCLEIKLDAFLPSFAFAF